MTEISKIYKAGDLIAFDIEDDLIRLRKARSVDLDSAGLPAPSVVRMKLFTLTDQFVIRQAGVLTQPDQRVVADRLGRLSSIQNI